MELNSIAKILFIIGGVFILAGVLWQVTGGNIPLGKLPGDIRIEGKNGGFYFPITSCILISVILTVIFRLFNK
jgi:hypothetical protein